MVDGKTTANICLRTVFAEEPGEPTATSKPRCTGTRDGAGGSAVVGLDPDAALITTAVDLLGANQDRYQKASRPQTLKSPASDEQLSDP